MKILYFQTEDWEKNFIISRLPGVEIEFTSEMLADRMADPTWKDNTVDVLSVFVHTPVRAAEMDRFPNLKMIATRSTGYDHIDLVEAKKRGIIVSNVPSYGENTVAEFACALLLTLSRKIYDAYKRIEDDSEFSTTGLRGFDLKGKTVGIVGTGRIGKHMIRMMKGFETNIIAYDKFPDEKVAGELGFKYVSFDEILAQSDIISLHAPATPETNHLINLENIGKMKKGVYLINTARGGLVDTSALVKGLQDGIIGGAGLDVLEEEGDLIDEDKLLSNPHPELENLRTALENHYLMEHPNVIVTPHNAFNTKEALERITITTAENIKTFLGGEVCNVVECP